MWARVVEIMLGIWLGLSPFVFRYGTEQISLWMNDFSCGFAVIAFGLLSFWKPTAWAHFLLLPLALWLIGFGYLAGHPAPPSAENHIIIGILLGMFTIIPNNTNEMPEPWKKFYGKKEA